VGFVRVRLAMVALGMRVGRCMAGVERGEGERVVSVGRESCSVIVLGGEMGTRLWSIGRWIYGSFYNAGEYTVFGLGFNEGF